MGLIKYVLCCLLLLGCTAKAIKSKPQNYPLEGSIDQVASQFITDLYQHNQLRIFRLDLPPSAVLADHVTGPRIIVLLTDLNGQRINDGSLVTGKAHQAFYLINNYSVGFKNTAAYTTSYLVIALGQQLLPALSPACPQPGFISLSAHGPVGVCQSTVQQNQAFSASESRLIYKQLTAQVEVVAAGSSVHIATGDLMMIFAE